MALAIERRQRKPRNPIELSHTGLLAAQKRWEGHLPREIVLKGLTEAEHRFVVDIIHTLQVAHRQVVHTYKGEGLTTCGLEVVGPCPDCATANGERT